MKNRYLTYSIRIYFLLYFLIISSGLFAQNNSTAENFKIKRQWIQSNPFRTDVFIENSGQFDPRVKSEFPVKYAVSNGENVFFTQTGLVYRLDKTETGGEKEREEIEKKHKKGKKVEAETFYVTMQWEGCNQDAVLSVSEQTEGYYTFGEKGFEKLQAKGYKKLTYKNLYPGVDVEYFISSKKIGIKYNLIIHPGADPSLVKMKYSGDFEKIGTDKNGNLIIKTEAGEITDHAPKSFYDGNTSVISSQFLQKNKTIQFIFPQGYDNSKMLIIDPWTVVPTGMSPNNCAFDVEYDDTGNVYASGGGQQYKVTKYSSTGTFLWTYTTPAGWGSTSQACYSKFCIIPHSGSIFMGEGFNPGSGPRVMKVNTNGAAVITTPNLYGTDEIWVMFYNRCIGKLFGFGGGINLSYNLNIMADTNLSSHTAVDFNGYGSAQNDISSARMDNNGDFYAIISSVASPDNGHLMKCLTANNYVPPLGFNVNANMGFQESINNGIPGFISYATARANALAVNASYVYTYDGKTVKAFNKTTGALLGSVVTNAGYASGANRLHEGIAVDDCNNVWVGGANKVFVYNFNGATFTAGTAITTNITGEVYDVNLNPSLNVLIVSGNGFLTTISVPPCGASLTITNTTSSTCSNGTASVTVTGGVPPYTYLWSNGATTSSITDVPGTYYITVSDNSCNLHIQFDTIVIAPVASFATSVSQTDVSCFGGNDGNATVTVTGGTGPFTYLWNDPAPAQTTATATILTAGNWSVVVADNLGCSVTVNVTITEPTQITAVTTNTNENCFGGNTATASVTASGGTSPYTYLWNDPSAQTTSTAIGLTAGTWTIQVTDFTSCQVSATAIVTEPLVLTASVNSFTDVLCNGGSDGTATVTATGGSGLTYSFLWNDPAPAQTSALATGLSVASWSVVVTDSLGCSANASILISEPAALSTSMINTDVTCFGMSDGTATVTVTGGTLPYTYLWDDPAAQTTAAATGLTMGTWNVQITDANGCITTASVTIAESTLLTATTTNINITCNGANDGKATITVNGGATPYTYVWNDPAPSQTTATATGLSPGIYNVLATDNFGCTVTASVTITEPVLLTSSVSTVTNVTCHGGNNGGAVLTVFGGTPPLTTFWSNGQVGLNLVNVFSGNFISYTTDVNGCSTQSDITITEPAVFSLTTTQGFFACAGRPYTIAAYTTGGTPNYTYYWNGQIATSTLTINPTTPVTYSAYAIDANGCISNTSSLSISIYPPLLFNIFANNDSVCPNDQVLISAIASGGNGGPYTVYDAAGQIQSFPIALNPVQSGTFVFTVHDGCNYSAVDDVYIYVYPLPVVSFYSDIVKGCAPLTVHFIESSPDSGQTFVWNFGSNDPINLSFAQNPSHIYYNSGTYDVQLTVTSEDGCKNNLLISDLITVYPLPDARFDAEPSVASIIEPIIHFSNYTTGSSSVNWMFGDGDTSNFWSPSHQYAHTGTYPVSLIAITDNYCRDTVMENIIIKDEYTFFAPTSFTPDRNGFNDMFSVSGVGIDPATFHLYIFNRWGELIFETSKFYPETSKSEGWDGRIKGYGLVENGTYTWLVIYNDLQKVKHEKTGPVTLIR